MPCVGAGVTTVIMPVGIIHVRGLTTIALGGEGFELILSMFSDFDSLLHPPEITILLKHFPLDDSGTL